MGNGPRRRCLVLAVAALIAGCGEPYVPADMPPEWTSNGSDLPYRVQAGTEFGYQIDVEAKWEEYTETYQGALLYNVVSAKADQIELKCRGELAGKRSTATLGVPPLPVNAGPPVIGAARKTLLLGRRGNVIEAYPMESIPFALGDLDVLVFEEFPEEDKKSWHEEHEVVIQEGRFPMRLSRLSSMQRDAKERIDYTVADSPPDSVRVTKRYSLRTEPGLDVYVGDLDVTGDGEFVFNVDRGLIESHTMKYRYTTKQEHETHTATITVTCVLLTPDELVAEAKAWEDKLQWRQERTRENAEDRKYPELKGLSGTERTLAKLQLSDERVVSEALEELSQTSPEERSPHVAWAIARHLRSSDVTMQQHAAQALIHWGTRDVEAEVVEATKSRESLVAKYAQEALAQIRSQPRLPAYRTWRDTTGQFEIEAEFVELKGNNVTLKGKDGQVFDIALDKLSEDDRRFIEQPQSGSDVPPAGTESPAVAASPPPTKPDPPPTKPVEPAVPKNTTPPRPVVPLDTTPVNLLAQIDPQRDRVRGTWKMEGGSLVTPTDTAAVLMIPGTVPPQYKLTVVAQRIRGTDSLNLGLIVGGRQTMLALEGWGVRASGLNTVNGKTAHDNPTTFKSPVFSPGKPATIVCTVRRSSVHVSCNGQSVMDWSGAPGLLDLDRRYWSHAPANRLFLGSWSTSFRISKLELVPVR